MAENVEERNLGRLRYFEPTTLTFNNTPTSDAIVFPYDDYNIAVDLTVFTNDRYSCGFANETNEQKVLHFATTAGTLSFLGGTDNFLTTNFTDIQNVDPRNNTQECLGIESINISYDSWLHPTVVVKFVDVRGATVMQPSEQEYYNEGNRGEVYHLYKSLFTMPYPLFILKVKGFYGKGVTYRLAVNKTDIDFDSKNGNFVLTVNFIGHMYGLFADVPMTCLAIAPYTEEGDKYWKEKIASNEFCFYRYDDNGNEVMQSPMLKFPELAKKIAEVECAQSIANAQSETHEMMQDIDEDIEALTHIINCYNDLFVNDNVKYFSYFEEDTENPKYSYMFICGVENTIASHDSGIGDKLTAFSEALSAYDDKFSGGQEKIKGYFGAIDTWVNDSEHYYVFTKDQSGWKYNGHTWSWYESKDEHGHAVAAQALQDDGRHQEFSEPLMKFLVDCVEKKSYENMTTFKLYVHYRGSSKYSTGIKYLTDRKNALEKRKVKYNEDYKKEHDSLVEQALGFRPSIKNIFDLAFAHLETFMHVYFKHLEVIKNQLEKDRTKREKTTYGIGDGDTDTETPKEGAEGIKLRGNYLPPFATFYEDCKDEENNSITRKKEIWPGKEGALIGNPEENLEEIKFVYELLNGSKLYFEESQEANRIIEGYRASGTTVNAVQSGPATSVENFIPITVYDIANNGSFPNPYASVAKKIQNNASIDEIIGDIYAIFALRMFYYMVSSTESSDSSEAGDFGRVEAINFYKAVGITHSRTFVDFIKKFADDANVGDEKTDFIKQITTPSRNPIRSSWQIEGSQSTNSNLFAHCSRPERRDTSKYWGGFIGVLATGGMPFSNNIGAWIGKEIDRGVDYLEYKYAQEDANTHFKYYPLCFNGTNELKHDFSNGNLQSTNRYISTINHGSYYGGEGSLQIGKPLPGGTFVLYETRDYVNTLMNNIGAELTREKSETEDEDAKGLFDIDFDVKRGSKTFRRITKEVNENCNRTTIGDYFVYIDGENSGNTLSDSEIDELIRNGGNEDLENIAVRRIETRCAEHKYFDNNGFYSNFGLFDTDIYNLQTSIYAKAYLFLLAIPLVFTDCGLVNKTNTVIQKASLLKEGAFYWWMYNRDVDFVSGGTVPEYLVCIDKNKNEMNKETHVNAFSLPKCDETFYLQNSYSFICYTSGSTFPYRQIPSAFVGMSDNISDSRKIYLKKYFEHWAETEFSENLDVLEDLNLRLPRQDGSIVYGQPLNLDFIKMSVGLESDSNNVYNAKKLQRFLKKLLLSVCTVFDYYGGFYGQDMVVEVADFKNGFRNFMDQLNRVYGKIAAASNDEIGKAFTEMEMNEDPFKSEDLRLSTYMTLKSLYNKWICGATKGENTWKIARSNRSSRSSDFSYGGNVGNKTIYDGDSGLYELDNFIYMDSLYRDIGYNLRVNLTKVADWITTSIPSAAINEHEGAMNYNSRSLYEFLTEVAQDCGGMLIAIPQRFMFNNTEDIKTIFTPIPSCQKWDDNSYTYMFLYTYKPSEHLGDSSTSNIDMNGWSPDGDGFSFTDDEIVGALFDNNDFGYGVPAFGVTFGKGNQSYFKDIKLSTGQYGVTEAGLNATFQIAAKGSETVRQTTLYGQDIYKVYANNAYECTVEMMGDMQIFPPMYFQLNNVPLWKGAYMIKKVTHVITPGDATTTIVGVRQNRNLIPFTDGDIVSLVSDKPAEAPTDTPVLGANVEANSIAGTGSVNQNPNPNFNAGADESDIDPSNITREKPLICITPAHGPNTEKSKEWAWSTNLIDNYIIPRLRTKTFKDGTSYNKNVHRCNKGGAHTTANGYSMVETRNLVTKYGSDNVISIVPHWNGCGGNRLCVFYGRATGCTTYQVKNKDGSLKFYKNGKPVMWYKTDCTTHEYKREDSRRFASYLRAAGEELLQKVRSGAIKKAPDGMLSKVTYESDGLFNYMLTPNCTDGAVQQNCACILTENFFADYTVNNVSWSNDSTYKTTDANGKYQTGRGWLESEEGLAAIADMHVNAIVNYINSIGTESTAQNNVGSVNGYNIDAACEWIQSHSYSATTHACAAYVRSAIDVGFNTSPNGNNSYTGNHGRPDWAYKYSTFLPTIGFTKIATIPSSQAGGYVPQKGDIAVYKKGTDSEYPGHICMYTGTRWCSDFKQNGMYVYGALNTPEIDIFRMQGTA